MATENQNIRANGWTDEEIRANIAYQEAMVKRFQNELGFVPDIEDWEEYE